MPLSWYALDWISRLFSDISYRISHLLKFSTEHLHWGGMSCSIVFATALIVVMDLWCLCINLRANYWNTVIIVDLLYEECWDWFVSVMGHYSCLQDPWWNPAVEEQAVLRIHRIGQTKRVMIKRFIVKVLFIFYFLKFYISALCD